MTIWLILKIIGLVIGGAVLGILLAGAVSLGLVEWTDNPAYGWLILYPPFTGTFALVSVIALLLLFLK